MSLKSEKNLEILTAYIGEFVTTNGYPPSVREMAKKLNVSSTATVHYYLKKLEDRKIIRKSSSKNRTVELINRNNESNTNYVTIPVVGKVAAGTPILAVENIEDKYTLPKNLFPSSEDMFVLKVTGDSMVNAGIFDGDKIVVVKQNSANNGEIIVALVDDSATVKRFYKEKNQIRLQPENDFMSPIYVKTCEILGKVVGLIRKF